MPAIRFPGDSLAKRGYRHYKQGGRRRPVAVAEEKHRLVGRGVRR